MERYVKHINFKEIGLEGQKLLSSATVVIVGAGGLGSNFANLFVRSGFKKVRLIDKDKIELSNLQRQLMYDEGDIGLYKAEVLAKKLSKVNSKVNIESIVCEFNSINATELLKGFDIVIDATDNFKTRYIIDDVCFELRIPWVFTGILGAEAQTMVINPSFTKRLSDLIPKQSSFADIEPNSTSSVLAPSVSIIASMAFILAVKVILKQDYEPNTMLVFDTWNNIFKKVQL